MAREQYSSDDGPGFISELLKDMQRLRAQQEAIEEKMMRASAEQVQIRRRLDAVEASLRAIGVREGDLAIDAARREGRMMGQQNSVLIVVAIVGPLTAAFLSWFIPATLEAIRYSQVDSERTHPPQYQGPPVPPRLNGKPEVAPQRKP